VTPFDGVLNLGNGSIQTLLQRVLRLRTSARQTFLQLGQRRRGEEEEHRVQGRVVRLDELHPLSIDIEDAPTRLIGNVLDGLDAGPIPIARKLGVLDKLATLDHLDERGVGGEMVVYAIDLARTGRTGGMRDGKAKLGRVGRKESVEEGGFTRTRGTTDDEGLRGRFGVSSSAPCYRDRPARLTLSIIFLNFARCLI
jgi:hypothetical protein